MKKTINFDELALLVKEYVAAMGAAEQCRENLENYLTETDGFAAMAEMVSKLTLLLK